MKAVGARATFFESDESTRRKYERKKSELAAMDRYDREITVSLR